MQAYLATPNRICTISSTDSGLAEEADTLNSWDIGCRLNSRAGQLSGDRTWSAQKLYDERAKQHV